MKHNVYVLYYRKDGKKRSMICNNDRELGFRMRQLEWNHRKYLGHRRVTLQEVSN